MLDDDHRPTPPADRLNQATARHNLASSGSLTQENLHLFNALAPLLPAEHQIEAINAIVPVRSSIRVARIGSFDLRRTTASVEQLLRDLPSGNRAAVVSDLINEATVRATVHLPPAERNVTTRAAALHLLAARHGTPSTLTDATLVAQAQDRRTNARVLEDLTFGTGVAAIEALANPNLPGQRVRALVANRSLTGAQAQALMRNPDLPGSTGDLLTQRFPKLVDWSSVSVTSRCLHRRITTLLSTKAPNPEEVLTVLANRRTPFLAIDMVLRHEVGADPLVRGMALGHLSTPPNLAEQYVEQALVGTAMFASEMSEATLMASRHPRLSQGHRRLVYDSYGWKALSNMVVDGDIVDHINLGDVPAVAAVATPDDVVVFEALAQRGRLGAFEWLAVQNGSMPSQAWAASLPHSSLAMTHPAIAMVDRAVRGYIEEGGHLAPDLVAGWSDMPAGHQAPSLLLSSPSGLAF